MMSRREPPRLSAAMLLQAYSQGWFPMVHEDGQLHWHDPDPRAVFPLAGISPNTTTRRVIRSGRFRCTIDGAFEQVMRACADRETTWINATMIQAYGELHRLGHAHSVEAWHDRDLAGGIYGVHIGGAFFGESMFSRESNAGKVAFHHLVDHLKARGFTLFDTQYINDFTRSLGACDIPRSEFREQLAAALSLPLCF